MSHTTEAAQKAKENFISIIENIQAKHGIKLEDKPERGYQCLAESI